MKNLQPDVSTCTPVRNKRPREPCRLSLVLVHDSLIHRHELVSPSMSPVTQVSPTCQASQGGSWQHLTEACPTQKIRWTTKGQTDVLQTPFVEKDLSYSVPSPGVRGHRLLIESAAKDNKCHHHMRYWVLEQEGRPFLMLPEMGQRWQTECVMSVKLQEFSAMKM